MWPDRRLLDLLKSELPLIQAPMAGAMDSALAIAVMREGALGSLPCAMLTLEEIAAETKRIRAASDRPFNMNFFCHVPPIPDAARADAWRARLDVYYRALGVDTVPSPVSRTPFDESHCALVCELRPAVVSFHFGLPRAALVERVKAAGCVVLSSATTVREARWLEERGADAIIAQGFEGGGHRGMFLSEDTATQVGTFALVPQIADAVTVPVIASGGIADGRGIAAAFALGASGVQIGTAYLKTPEAKISTMHREALATVRDDETVLTNVLTGRPARGMLTRLVREMGPLRHDLPDFPLAADAVLPLRRTAEPRGSGDFSPLWSGQAAALARPAGAADMTRAFAVDALAALRALAPRSFPTA